MPPGTASWCGRGDALERLATVKKIAFDKTGTLTYGTPVVTAVKEFHPGISETELFAETASAELWSEHPLGKAIVTGYHQLGTIIEMEVKRRNGTIFTVIGLVIGVMILGAGLYYLAKERNDAVSRKIYGITCLAGLAIIVGVRIKVAVVGL